MGKRKQKRFEPYELEDIILEKFVNGGQALGYAPDGKPVFVWGALAGETVDVLVTKSKGGILEGLVAKLKVASDHRVEAKEPDAYMSTSPWQVLDFGFENETKLDLLKQTFQHEAGIDLGRIDFFSGEQEFGYRNKMEYNFWGDNEGVHLALHKRGTEQKIKLKGSALASESINQAGEELVEVLNAKEVFAGELKSLVLRSSNSPAGEGECVGALFVKKKEFKEVEVPASLKGLVCYYSDPRSPASVMTKELWRKGDIKLKDRVLDVELEYDVNSFFQVNVPVFEQTILDIRAKLNTETKEVTDFYGGVGSIGVLTAGERRLRVVEVHSESAKMAEENLSRLKLKDAKVICLPGEESLDSILEDSTLIVDPPRAGLHKRVVQQIGEVKPKQVVYLSCNPVTQARDVKILLEAGYKISFARGYNFFPRTPHIESLVILEA